MTTAQDRIAAIDRRIAARQAMVDVCRRIGDLDSMHAHQSVIGSLMTARIQIHDHCISPIAMGCP
jgi:hypothetical protein